MWTIGNPEDLESFPSESERRHEAAPRTLYSPGEDVPGTTDREEFVRAARKQAEDGETSGIQSAADMSGGWVTTLECWTTPVMPAEPDGEDRNLVLEAMASHPELPF